MCLTTEGEAEACSLASWLWLNCVPPACALRRRLILMTRWGSEAPGPNALRSQWDIHSEGGMQPLSPHMIPLQLDSLSVYLVRCLLLQWLEILRQWLDDWQQTREEFSQGEQLMQCGNKRPDKSVFGWGGGSGGVGGHGVRAVFKWVLNIRHYPSETELCC